MEIDWKHYTEIDIPVLENSYKNIAWHSIILSEKGGSLEALHQESDHEEGDVQAVQLAFLCMEEIY